MPLPPLTGHAASGCSQSLPRSMISKPHLRSSATSPSCRLSQGLVAHTGIAVPPACGSAWASTPRRRDLMQSLLEGIALRAAEVISAMAELVPMAEVNLCRRRSGEECLPAADAVRCDRAQHHCAVLHRSHRTRHRAHGDAWDWRWRITAAAKAGACRETGGDVRPRSARAFRRSSGARPGLEAGLSRFPLWDFAAARAGDQSFGAIERAGDQFHPQKAVAIDRTGQMQIRHQAVA